jgi:hypothetical protein
VSAIHNYSTSLSNAGQLAEAIELESGIKAELHEADPKRLEGGDDAYWAKDNPQLCQVILRRQAVREATGRNNFHDIGFQRQADGNFKVVMSDMDVHRGYNQAWVTRVQQRYQEVTVMTELRGRGYTEFERSEIKTDKGIRVAIRAKTPTTQIPATQTNAVRL